MSLSTLESGTYQCLSRRSQLVRRIQGYLEGKKLGYDGCTQVYHTRLWNRHVPKHLFPRVLQCVPELFFKVRVSPLVLADVCKVCSTEPGKLVTV